ncbi:deoxycytidylate deaminase-like isoform X2 [Osmia bicornis bicornis]|uniref:deoxycytidylate deaminase-like isoform X2 n=1 Tax=Osmia bicornis bicornis TaxID=1437191 RepID=UPI001EAEBA8F|nr:deoxycytidylate deaminase-like isoform X2 [Osmia bicornis bicornis]
MFEIINSVYASLRTIKMAQGGPGRSGEIDDKRFMEEAHEAKKPSNDNKCQVGACIVNDEKEIVGTGYNAMPGYLDTEFPFVKNKYDPLECKLTYVCHAELNAIVNKKCDSIKNSTIYVTRHPCNECAKLIVQSGIKCVVYDENPRKGKYDVVAAKRIFDTTGVTLRGS